MPAGLPYEGIINENFTQEHHTIVDLHLLLKRISVDGIPATAVGALRR
jgi:hypothetical protein